MSDVHDDLKIALKLLDLRLVDFAVSLKRPDGNIGISHTAVIRVAKGQDETMWIRQEIMALIRKAHRLFPEYYKYHSSVTE